MRRYTLSLLFLGAILAGCGGSGGPADSTTPLATSGTGSVSSPANDSGVEDGSFLRGSVTSINTTARSFQVKESSGSFAVGSTITITTTSTTRFRDAFGNTVSASTWFSKLAVGKRVEAEGAKTGPTSLRASKVKIEK